MSAGNSGEYHIWEPKDLEEERERVVRHLAMAREMLAYKDEGQDTICYVGFFRIIEQDDMQAIAPGEHIGFLLGIEEGQDPALVIGALSVHLTTVDELTDEITADVIIEQADVATIPVREVDDFFGATPTPEAWEHLRSLPGS